MKRAVIVQASDKTLNCQLQSVDDAGIVTPLDITGATEIDAIFPNADGTCVHKKLSLSQIAITNALLGQFSVALLAVDTNLLLLTAVDADSGASVYVGFEVHVTLSGKVTVVNLPQSLDVQARLFPNC